MEYFDFGVNSALFLIIFSTLISIVYGILNWNKDGYEKPPSHVKEWNKTENEIEEEL